MCCCFRKWLPSRYFTAGIRYKGAVLPHKWMHSGFKISFAVNVSFVPEHQRCCRSGGQLEHPMIGAQHLREPRKSVSSLSVNKMHHIGIDLGSGDKWHTGCIPTSSKLLNLNSMENVPILQGGDLVWEVKGIVHPKIHWSKPLWVSFFCWTQNNIFWRVWVIKQLMVVVDYFFSILWKSMATINCIYV